MNKGDLVTHIHTSLSKEDLKFWDEPAMVVRGPYEKSQVTEFQGARVTQIFVAIDIMHKGTLLTGVKKDNFVKVQN